MSSAPAESMEPDNNGLPGLLSGKSQQRTTLHPQELSATAQSVEQLLAAAAERGCAVLGGLCGHGILLDQGVHESFCAQSHRAPLSKECDLSLVLPRRVAEMVRKEHRALEIQISGSGDRIAALAAPVQSEQGVVGAIVVVNPDVSVDAPLRRLAGIADQVTAALPRLSPRGNLPPRFTQSEFEAAERAVAAASWTYRFKLEGEYWCIGSIGAPCYMKNVRGLHYIAQLLRHPRREFHVCDLTLIGRNGLEPSVPSVVAGSESACATELCSDCDPVSAQPLLDAHAKASYRRRLCELRDEIDEAETYNDTGRASQLRAESDFLVQQLASAMGLGGRDRLTVTAAERARQAVTRCIKDALKKICIANSPLGHSLCRSIRTGYYCSYVPDPVTPISWDL